jgi:hypothetical protein
VQLAGTFTTTKYADRAAYLERRPSGVLVSRNAFVAAGLDLMWRILLGQVRNEDGGLSDHLGKGRLIVGNGDAPVQEADERLAGEETAWAELDDGYPRFDGMVTVNEAELDEPEATPTRACRVTFQATFGEDVANFDWLERGITSVQGVLIDRSVEDHGRKAAGSVWTLNAALDLLP